MLALNTPIKLEKIGDIGYNSKLFFIGSCFSDEIGTKFSSIKFNALVNPFGVLFNPISIRTLLSNSLDRIVDESAIIENNNLYVSLLHHSKLYNQNREQLIKELKFQTDQVNRFLKRTNYLFITFGSAFVYKHLEKDLFVANCHKLPGNEFSKEFIDIETEISAYKKLIQQLKAINPSIQVVFTVSPVRHQKDGFHQNNQSKGALHLIIKGLEDEEGVHYFPSYEIVLDELRDYRFYKNDMLHPSDLAVNIIFNRLVESNVDSGNQLIMSKVIALQKMTMHKPLHVENYSTYANDTMNKINIFENEYPQFCFKTEKDMLRRFL